MHALIIQNHPNDNRDLSSRRIGNSRERSNRLTGSIKGPSHQRGNNGRSSRLIDSKGQPSRPIGNKGRPSLLNGNKGSNHLIDNKESSHRTGNNAQSSHLIDSRGQPSRPKDNKEGPSHLIGVLKLLNHLNGVATPYSMRSRYICLCMTKSRLDQARIIFRWVPPAFRQRWQPPQQQPQLPPQQYSHLHPQQRLHRHLKKQPNRLASRNDWPTRHRT